MPRASENDSTRLPSRRGLIGAAAAVITVAPAPLALAAAPHPDAELLALRPAFLAALAEEEPLRAEYRRTRDLAEAQAGPEPRVMHRTAEWATWDARFRAERARVGGVEALDRWSEASVRLHAVMDRMAEIPATTLDGLRFKALAFERDEMFADRIVADLLALGRMPAT